MRQSGRQAKALGCRNVVQQKQRDRIQYADCGDSAELRQTNNSP